MIYKYNQLCPVTFGAGASGLVGENCKELGAKKILVVTDKTIAALGIPTKALESLKASNITYEVYDGVEMDAPDRTIEEGADMARKMEADGVVGIGGGSTLDTAKAISVVAAGDITLQELISLPPETRNQLKTIMVPTTSGTGSESTIIAVIKNSRNHHKIGVFALPHAAIVDPELTMGLDKEITVYTAMDAFSHSAEALSSAFIPNPHSDLLAFDAIGRIVKWLPRAIEDVNDFEARENLALASNFAGKAFADATVHVGHAIAHSLGVNFHIPHGVGCALTTPAIIEYMTPACPQKYKKVGELLGVDVSFENTEVLGKNVADALRRFMKRVGSPSCKDLGISRTDIFSCVEYAKNEVMVNLGQRKPTDEELEHLLELIYDSYQ